MDTTAAHFVLHAKLPSCSPSIIFHCKSSVHSIRFRFSINKTTLLSEVHGFRVKSRKFTSFDPVYASESDQSAVPDSDRWLLEPVGDGDSRHIGYQVKMPDAIEIASNEVTVGRLPEKADVVIPVATVSGVHARIENKGENLLITDLDSTNGTFINEQKLRPGIVAYAPSGSFITFGDIHLAMFRASKIVNEEPQTKPEAQEETT